MLARADSARLARMLEEINAYNRSPGCGTTRPVYTVEYMAARSFVRGQMEALGLEVREDCAGNLFGLLPGSDPALAPVWTGSHLDTVPNGGMYDGMAGVFAGLEALRLIRESGAPHARGISVNVYAGEEMSRFGVCCIGSRCLAGRLDEAALEAGKDPDGRSLAQTLRDLGFDTGRFSLDFPLRDPVYAHLELHIEQNSVLEKKGLPLGIVTGICAPTNLVFEVTGVQSHAGGTSMLDRRDAFMAAAEASMLLERLARESDSVYITGTVGQIALEPNVASVIPGKAVFTVDIRSISLEDKDALLDRLSRGMEEIAARRGVSISARLLNHDRPVVCDGHLCGVLRDRAAALEIPCCDLISGPYHDSLFLGDLTKVGMLFVPSRGGISHDRAEFTRVEDIAAGTDVLAAAMLELADEV